MSEMNSGNNRVKSGPILLAEDNASDIYLFKMAVEDLKLPNGFVSCKNGQEALHYLRTEKETPFLIFSDINMPGMNGIELRQVILEDNMLRKKVIPFIYLTSSSEDNLVKQAFYEHAQGYFEKSGDVTRLKDNLRVTVEYWSRSEVPNDVSKS